MVFLGKEPVWMASALDKLHSRAGVTFYQLGLWSDIQKTTLNLQEILNMQIVVTSTTVCKNTNWINYYSTQAALHNDFTITAIWQWSMGPQNTSAEQKLLKWYCWNWWRLFVTGPYQKCWYLKWIQPKGNSKRKSQVVKHSEDYSTLKAHERAA